MPQWHDVSPRFGISYDLFGDGKTAAESQRRPIRARAGGGHRQCEQPADHVGAQREPQLDGRNGDFIPDCDFSNPALNGECRASGEFEFRPEQPTRHDLRSGGPSRVG